MLASRRQSGFVDQRPLLIWEPAPLSCENGHLSSFISAIKLVDVFSPNHLELFRIFGEKPSTPFNRMQVERLAKRFLHVGVGPEQNGSIIVRAGEHGSMTLATDGVPYWIPPYYHDDTSSKAVDATGAGNAFLGAYAIGLLKTKDSHQAACYGSVAASFALEQIGIPHRTVSKGHELWNGEDVHKRLKLYMEGLPPSK